MRYTVKNKARDTFIQNPFSDKIISAFKNDEKQIKIGMGTVVNIVDYDVVGNEEIVICVEVE